MTPSILIRDDSVADVDQRGSADVSGWPLYTRAAAGTVPAGSGVPAEPGHNLLGAAIALRAALEQTGDALATPRVTDLLESEAALAAALAILPVRGTDLGPDRDRILRELALARHELRRCRRLGAALAETVKHALGDQGRAADYGPDGQVADLSRRAAGALQTRG